VSINKKKLIDDLNDRIEDLGKKREKYSEHHWSWCTGGIDALSLVLSRLESGKYEDEGE
jgi:hypothetical protein